MITSNKNDKIKNIIKLQKSPKERKKQDCHILESVKMLNEVDSDDVLEVFCSESYYSQLLINNKSNIYKNKYSVVTDNIFNNITDTVTPQGVLAIIKQKHYNIQQILENKDPLIMVIEDIKDPGNLGTIMRTAEAAGVDGIILSKNTVDIYNPKVVRSTMGSIFRVPFIIVDNVISCVKQLKAYSIKCYAAHLEGSFDYEELNYTQATAFLIGNESHGLSADLSNLADKYIKIPMLGKVESLNASIAASILMYEVFRQRKAKSKGV